MLRSFVVVALSLLLMPSLSYGTGEPLFSKKYERGGGKPSVVTDTVAACNTGATYKLVVVNGEGGVEGGKNRVSSASVTLNGEKVVGERDFNQRVGTVEVGVSLSAENTIEVKAASKPGSFITVNIFCEANCLGVEIESPGDGDGVDGSRAIVRGSVINLYGETGITITNEVEQGGARFVAHREGPDFAGLVELAEGTNTITATATDACGFKATDMVEVTASGEESGVRLSANPVSGVPSLKTGTMEVSFRVSGGTDITNYSWDFDGDGTADEQGTDLSEVTASYQEPGLYFATITATRADGTSASDVTVINVLSKEEADIVLKAKWGGMKGGLASGDIEKALAYFSAGSRGKYEEIFDLLKDDLSDIASNMQDITFLYVQDGTAKYRVRRDQMVDGQEVQVTYYLYFTLDENGIWKVVSF